MAEHGARYARFAKALTGAGFAVYAQDLPGHGRTAAQEELGHFADRDGWAFALAAIDGVRRHVEAQHPDRPLFLFGHSMGSFLLQHHLLERGDGVAGAILSGTHGDLGPARAAGLALMRLEAMLLGARHPSALAEALTFRSYARRFRPRRTEFDWLSRDPQEVDKYVHDPLCGFRCTAGLWADLLSATAHLTDPMRLQRLPRQLPVLMIAGSRDPVSEGERGPRVLEQAYLAAGLADVEVRIYREGRHELLNDTCREQVTAYALVWLRNHLSAARS
ncbi:MAG: lysophospholipase [Gammaproteobacteria bacterium]|nr:lysophospholipase [Gammaproteobacteria bacterium]